MARQRPTTLELSDRDYRRLRRALWKLDRAQGRRETQDAEDALEDLADELEIPGPVVDDLLAGDVQLEDDDDGGDDGKRGRRDDDDDGKRGRSRRRDDDDDGKRGRSRRRDDDDDGKRGSSSTRRVRVVDRDDDDAGDDGKSRRAQSLKDLRDRPGSKPARRRKEDPPAETPQTTHWFHRPLGRTDAAAGGAS